MQANDNPFPVAGDNFRTVARADSDLELSLVILDLGFPVLDDGYGYDELAADYGCFCPNRQIGLFQFPGHRVGCRRKVAVHAGL